jgi:hypothetical protein
MDVSADVNVPFFATRSAMKRSLAAVCAASAAWLSGCGKPESPPPASSEAPAAAVDKSAEAAIASTSPAPTPPSPPPTAPEPPKFKSIKQWPRPERRPVEPALGSVGSPEETVEALAKALGEGKYQAVWEALPAKHQSELKAVVAEFTNRVDPMYYDQVVNMVETGTKLLEKHKERFFAHPISGELPIEREKLEKAWDPLIAIGKALLDSELYDLEELRAMEMSSFFASTVPRVAQALPALAALEWIPTDAATEYLGMFESLKSAKASRVSEADGKVVLRIESEGQAPREVEFVQVEEKWIPSALEERWPEFLEWLRSWTTYVPDKNNKEESQKALFNLLGPSIALSGVLNSNTDEAFDKSMKGIQSILKRLQPQEGVGGGAAEKPALQ